MASLAELASKETAALESLPAAPALDLAVAWRTVNTLFNAKVKKELELTLPKVKPQFKTLQSDVVWAYSSPRPPTKLNAELEGAALALISPFEDDAKPVIPSLITSWVLRGGLPFALQSIAKSFGAFTILGRTYADYPSGDVAMLVASESHPWVPLQVQLDAFLRSELSRASEEDRAAAKNEAAELRKEATLGTRSILSCIFLESSWIDADLKERLETKRPAVFTGLSLLKAGDSALVAQFLGSLTAQEVEHLAPGQTYRAYGIREVRTPPFAHALLARFPDGAPSAAWMKRTARRVCELDSYRRGPAIASLEVLMEAAKSAPENEAVIGAVVDTLTILQNEKFTKAEDPRPALIDVLRGSPRLAAAPVKAAAQKKAKWAVTLAPQLERASDKPATPVRAGEFWLPASFTPIKTTSGAVLSEVEIEALGQALRNRDEAALAQLRDRCTPASLAAFAWDLFSAWLNAGAPAPGRWALQSLGDFGNDDIARKLTPMIREWPGESAHQRAVWGLEVLSAIGTDTALLMLDSVAQRVKFRGLQDNARVLMNGIARRRGLSPAALSDRLVPDLGLDKDGSKTLSFGDRSFRVGFDGKLLPFVTSNTGKRLAELPKPGAKDDKAKAARSVELWKELKASLKSEGPAIVLRFEMAMADERRWTPKEFAEIFLEHPLLMHLVRRLLWGVFGADGKLREAFRVTTKPETILGAPLELPKDATVGLVHPLLLSEDQAAVLADAFATDGEVPFEQLNRKVFTLGPKEWDSPALTRFEGLTAPPGKLRGLRERGWRMGPALDAGSVNWLTRDLGNGTVAALNIDGLYVSGGDPDEPVTIGSIVFGDDLDNENLMNPDDASTRPVDSRSRVAMSELLRDIDSIVNPG